MLSLKYIAEPGCEPVYGNDHAAGLDLRAAESVALFVGVDTAVRTGLRVEIPPGHVGLIRGRSGLAFRQNIFGFEGTIDEDYRGEILVLLRYDGNESVTMDTGRDWHSISAGDRVAQLVIVPVARLRLDRVDLLGDSSRGTNGFGSTGAR